MRKNQIVDAVALYGADAVTFKIPMRAADNILGIRFTSSSDPEEIVECTIDEDVYRVADNYKIKLRAKDELYGIETFYIMDLLSLMCDLPALYMMTVTGKPCDVA